MTEETLILYKLIILYFLLQTRQAIPNAVISDFILDSGYTDYLSIQQTLSLMTEDNMINVRQTHAVSYYEITPKGIETFEFFGNQLPADTKCQIKEYLRKNHLEIAEDTAIRTDYTAIRSGEYQVNCSLWEHNTQLCSLSLNVPNEEAALRVCQNYRKRSGDIYEYLLQQLF